MRTLAICLLAALGAGAAEDQAKAPIASAPVVELKGKIAKVQIAAGQGMPYIEVDSGGKTSRVYLGSMRYLMEQDFAPKSGAAVDVKGYRMNDDVVAISVSLDGGKTVRLRDESGYPLWMGGRGRGPGGAGKGRMAGKR